GQLLAPVAAVLHQEAVQALLLGDVHQGPQLVQLGGDRRFDADVLAAPQRGRRLGVVRLPGGGDVDEVGVVGLRRALVVGRTPAMERTTSPGTSSTRRHLPMPPLPTPMIPTRTSS